jgi:hypothetical protein
MPFIINQSGVRGTVTLTQDGRNRSWLNVEGNYSSTSLDNVEPLCSIGRDRARAQRKGKRLAKSSIETPNQNKTIAKQLNMAINKSGYAKLYK